ncbi:MAG: 30S ribosomal protein S6 [bacterium]|nr:30S ribosomal protein S6 [bacterium]
MRNYELSLLVNPTLEEEGIQGTLQQVTNFLQESEGIIQSQSLLGKRVLPAPVLKQNEAYLVSFAASLAPENVEQLEKKLKEVKNVLRFLLTVKKYRAVKTKAPRVRKIQKPLMKEASAEQKIELADIDKKVEEMIEKIQ